MRDDPVLPAPETSLRDCFIAKASCSSSVRGISGMTSLPFPLPPASVTGGLENRAPAVSIITTPVDLAFGSSVASFSPQDDQGPGHPGSLEQASMLRQNM